MTTKESKLKRASSSEKHVTIVDNASGVSGDTTKLEEMSRETASEENTKEEESSKEELAKILMQFDPLAQSTSQTDGSASVTVVDRSLNPNNPEMATSASSSPNSPQQLDSSSTSHNVQVDTSEKAKSGSTRKKSDSRPKGSLSPEAPKGSDRGTVGTSSSNSRSEPPQPPQPPQPKDIPFDFQKFLEQMRHKSAVPIMRYFQSFLKEFDKKPWTVNEQIKIIHDFLDFITGKMEMCELWKKVSDQEFENSKEGMEKLVMNRLYSYTFCPSTTDDAERDEVLSQKIRIFRWIKEEHLDIPHSPHNEGYLINAQTELGKINTFKAPRDKVICILNCCKYIFTLIRRAEGNSKGADTFLPILIYVVLRSNPPNLVSNVQYIYRFRNPEKLQAEAGYYLASLMGAISFIENLEASSLSITPEEFDQQIERTMIELSQEKVDAIAAATTTSKSQESMGHRKQDSKLATLLAGTAPTRNGRQRLSINEKQYLVAEATQQEKTALTQQQQQQQPGQGSRESKTSPAPLGSSILNPAAALIERGANFATRTIQKPLDLIERIFQDGGDEENMSKPYPPRPTQQQYSDVPPALPYRPIPQQQQQQQQQAQGQQWGLFPSRGDSFTEFVYVPAGQQ
ncbi:hypothetical protein BGZ65_006525, partial [Modicella reniformis]